MFRLFKKRNKKKCMYLEVPMECSTLDEKKELIRVSVLLLEQEIKIK